ncbi:MAG: hypothetical protein Q8K71_13180 [Polaromonas sp.]|nr:hypothetical protein [Polaromonas sp.]MDP3753177.1 hypothetical protein [Polaromonas sp.]
MRLETRKVGVKRVQGVFHNPEKLFHMVGSENAAARQNFSIREIIFRIIKNRQKNIDFIEEDFYLI